VGTPDGSPAPFRRVADLYFEDMEAVGAAFASEQAERACREAGLGS
jgi:hypothetical protein